MRELLEESPRTLCTAMEIATYGTESTFDQRLAKGFVELWGMQSTRQ